MSTGALYLSFWHICLDNLPEGAFARRRIAADEARRSIEQTRAENKLLCLCQGDLLAPCNERERKNHNALCQVLDEHFDIKLSLKDFVWEHKDDTGEGLFYTARPLNAAQIGRDYRLLVVTCAYGIAKKKRRDPPAFDIIPSTVEFIMIEELSRPAGDVVLAPEHEREVSEWCEAATVDLLESVEAEEAALAAKKR